MTQRSIYAIQQDDDQGGCRGCRCCGTHAVGRPKELIGQLVSDPMSADATSSAAMALKRALIEREPGAVPSHRQGYVSGAAKPEENGSHRNGASAKTMLTEDGPVRIEVQRARGGSFEPLFIPEDERRFSGFDDKIVAMNARGMTVRECRPSLRTCKAPRRDARAIVCLAAFRRTTVRARSRGDTAGDVEAASGGCTSTYAPPIA